MFTKSNYLSALQCKKRIWLEKNSDIEKASLTKSDLKRIEEGNRVGQAARGEGVLIDTLNWEKAVVETQKAIESGAERIFEAAFVFNGLGVRLDIIEKADNAWNLYEVKASTSLKPEHIPDILFQKYVATSAGLKINNNFIVLLNDKFSKEGVEKLFVYQNVNDEINKYINNIELELNEINQVLAKSDAPKIHVSRHCEKPATCPYIEHCWKDIPEKSIFSIPRLHKNKEGDLISKGIINIKDIPSELELSANQDKYVKSVVNNSIEINREGIKRKLDELTFPIYFFDIETAQDAIPKFDGVSPYTQLCFQFSCHVLKENGELEHLEFLHTDKSDPRSSFLNRLFETISDSGSIVVYNQQFEIGRFKEFKEWFPQASERLDNIINRVWDQMIIFKDYYMHPDFNGSISIKSVLPVLVPSLSYKDLEVSQGDEASAAWSEMIEMDEGEEKQRIATALNEYCKLDTLAMVEIYRVLSNVL